MSFDCFLSKIIVHKDAESTWTRFVTLPFPPMKGLSLDFDDAEFGDGGMDFTFGYIEYNLKRDTFYCYETDVRTDCPCKEEDSCCILTEEAKQDQISHGWELESESRGKDRAHNVAGLFGEVPEWWSLIPTKVKS